MESFEIFSLARQTVTLSEQMLDMAQQAQWAQFEKTEKQRQNSLKKIFQHPEIAGMLPKIAILLQQVLDYDKQSLQLGDDARKQTMHELAAIRSNVNAVGTYQQFSAFEIK